MSLRVKTEIPEPVPPGPVLALNTKGCWNWACAGMEQAKMAQARRERRKASARDGTDGRDVSREGGMDIVRVAAGVPRP
jgi:hypothetical protein